MNVSLKIHAGYALIGVFAIRKRLKGQPGFYSRIIRGAAVPGKYLGVPPGGPYKSDHYRY